MLGGYTVRPFAVPQSAALSFVRCTARYPQTAPRLHLVVRHLTQYGSNAVLSAPSTSFEMRDRSRFFDKFKLGRRCCCQIHSSCFLRQPLQVCDLQRCYLLLQWLGQREALVKKQVGQLSDRFQLHLGARGGLPSARWVSRCRSAQVHISTSFGVHFAADKSDASPSDLQQPRLRLPRVRRSAAVHGLALLTLGPVVQWSIPSCSRERCRASRPRRQHGCLERCCICYHVSVHRDHFPSASLLLAFDSGRDVCLLGGKVLASARPPGAWRPSCTGSAAVQIVLFKDIL